MLRRVRDAGSLLLAPINRPRIAPLPRFPSPGTNRLPVPSLGSSWVGWDHARQPLLVEVNLCFDLGRHMTYLVTVHGKPYTSTGFSDWFKRASVKAGIPHCSPHGLRKAVSRQLAEAGVTSLQGRAVTGHKTDREFQRYAAQADREHMAEQAVANLSSHLANRPKKPSKTNGSAGWWWTGLDSN